ncbi:hypothetical protein GCM10007094_10720 [Pseudovibrio japonicus]|uniref:Uncharacterized protein n=1 Tax=Pseudovibrio japonicus TaxID=366534 RepID=A0ABQ3E677_9HYPH|nr:hypothetical protein [Pseudovibrio japonicus]GHB24528.1 hypothetical protein GCM10007094_10720 [Pseudovibrio japonicus]
MIGDFTEALEEAIIESGDIHQKLMLQLLGDPQKGESFANIVFDLLKREQGRALR